MLILDCFMVLPLRMYCFIKLLLVTFGVALATEQCPIHFAIDKINNGGGSMNPKHNIRPLWTANHNNSYVGCIRPYAIMTV